MIRAAPDLSNRLQANPGAIQIRVEQAPDASVAAEALTRAAKEIDGTTDVSYVSRTIATPSGPYVFIDGSVLTPAQLDQVPAIIARHLEALGVTDGVLASVEPGGPLFGVGNEPGLSAVTRTVALRLYPPPPPARIQKEPRLASAIPSEWADEANTWLQATPDGHHVFQAAAGVTEFSLTEADCHPFLRQAVAGADRRLLVCGNQSTRTRGATFVPNLFVPFLGLAGGGPLASDDDLVAEFDSLCDIATRLAPTLAYAYIEIQPTFWPLLVVASGTEWFVEGGPSASPVLDLLVDEVVFDAFPFQILCPGHLRRLGAPPAGAEPLALGRAALRIGSPSDWLITEPHTHGRPHDRRDPEVQSRARDLLRGCLVQKADVDPLVAARKTSESTALLTEELDPSTTWRGVRL